MVKARGREYSGGFHDFIIRKGGMEVFPRLVPAEPREEHRPAVLPSGIASLDTLLGGGLMTGSSTLIVGPAGSGQSSLAMHPAVKAAECGSAHETTIRELKIGPEGIEVGEALRQFQGILSGEPVFTGAAGQLIQARDDKGRGT
jgi:circadian clock protein KaiC